MAINKSSIPNTSIYIQLDNHLLIINKHAYDQMSEAIWYASGDMIVSPVNRSTPYWVIYNIIYDIITKL